MFPLLPVTRSARPLIGLPFISTTDPAMLCHLQPSLLVFATYLTGAAVNGNGDKVYLGVAVCGKGVPVGAAGPPTTGVFVRVGVRVMVAVGNGVRVAVGGVAVGGRGVKVMVGVSVGRGDASTMGRGSVAGGNGFNGE